MASMVAKASSSKVSSFVSVQEKGSRNKRKFRADPPLGEADKIIPSPQNECPSYEFSAEKFEPTPVHGLASACDLCGVNQDHADGLKLGLGLSTALGSTEVELIQAREELEESTDADWSDLTESQLEELVLSNLDDKNVQKLRGEMEVKEAAERRAVIAKPVACRPTCNSTFGSFSELLAGAVNSPSPTPKPSQPSPIAATIKPKTLRFNPPAPQPHPESCRTIVYRPRAKLVSKRTASLLANMAPNGDPLLLPSFNSSHQEAGEELISPCSNNAVEAQAQQATEQLRISTLPIESQRLEAEDIPKAAVLSAAAASASVQLAYGDRPSYDGYNWRKYGQKQVKGSEYPRSYYKCTHPSCPVKKKVERSLDGQIAEIVYKGEHNHSKPSLPARRNSIGCEAVGGEIRMESGLLLLPSSSAAGTGSDGCRGSRPAADVEVQGDDDEPRTKRRRAEDRANDQSGNAGEAGGRETAGAADSEVLGDGFRWRKYGQKVVRGNLYPRSYYRCTNLKCKVRKYVERSPDDPNALVTTYEGKHNHDIPAP